MPYRNPKDPRIAAKYAEKRKWKLHADGLFHCSDQNPGCKFTHKRAASVGRHTAIHSSKPYARNTGKDRASKKDRLAQRKRDYAKEYYRRTKTAQTAIERSIQSNGNVDLEQARAFWISQTCADFKQSCAINAHRVDLTAEEFGSRCMAVLQGTSKTLRQLYRLPD